MQRLFSRRWIVGGVLVWLGAAVRRCRGQVKVHARIDSKGLVWCW